MLPFRGSGLLVPPPPPCTTQLLPQPPRRLRILLLTITGVSRHVQRCGSSLLCGQRRCREEHVQLRASYPLPPSPRSRSRSLSLRSRFASFFARLASFLSRFRSFFSALLRFFSRLSLRGEQGHRRAARQSQTMCQRREPRRAQQQQPCLRGGVQKGKTSCAEGFLRNRTPPSRCPSSQKSRSDRKSVV